MMVRYFYAWMPVVVIGTAVILTLPYLGLIALMVVLLAVVAALGALAWATVAAFYALGRTALGRSVPHLSRVRSDAREPVALNTGRVERAGTR